MYNQEGICEICYENPKLYQMDCSHQICKQCFDEWVCLKDICPFCKQTVTSVKFENNTFDLSHFDKPRQQEPDFFDESQFHLLNQDFFHEDIRILNQNLKRAQDYMRRVIRQIDHQFNAKWFAYDWIEHEIQLLDAQDPQAFYLNVEYYNSCLNSILMNNWNDQHLLDLLKEYKPVKTFDLVPVPKKKKRKRSNN
ncbi:hypothetical protein pb186bvf_000104 [Paramecium bursaria]